MRRAVQTALRQGGGLASTSQGLAVNEAVQVEDRVLVFLFEDWCTHAGQY